MIDVTGNWGADDAYMLCDGVDQGPNIITLGKEIKCLLGEQFELGIPGVGASNNTANVKITKHKTLPIVSTLTKTCSATAPITFSTTDFTDKYKDAPGSNLVKIKIISLPNNGTLTLLKSNVVVNQEIGTGDLGGLTYTPAASKNNSRVDSFSWNGSDGVSYSANGANVDIVITKQPVVEPSWIKTHVGAVVGIAAGGVAVVAAPIAYITYWHKHKKLNKQQNRLMFLTRTELVT